MPSMLGTFRLSFAAHAWWGVSLLALSLAACGESGSTDDAPGAGDPPSQAEPAREEGEALAAPSGADDDGAVEEGADAEGATGAPEGADPNAVDVSQIGEGTPSASTGDPERTYGYYLRRYASDVRGRGARLIFVTPVPRNYWSSETVTNNSVMAGYVGWMQEVARAEQLPLIDLNGAIDRRYASMGRSAVSAYFTSGDNTHTNVLGASRSAEAVLAGVRGLSGSDLSRFLSN